MDFQVADLELINNAQQERLVSWNSILDCDVVNIAKISDILLRVSSEVNS